MEGFEFENYSLSDEIQKAISDMGFEEATPIQSQAIPHIFKGEDIIGQAQTGTGKTCAFGIPAIEMLDCDSEDIQVLVLCPTRELAIQSAEELRNVSKYKGGVRILPVYGGQPIERQIMGLRKHPQIIIGTPGRIMDHMRRHTLKFGNLKMMILDEADEMLNMGFREDIDTILEKVPTERQTILFSATMPQEILNITEKYQKNPVHIKITHKELTVPGIEQYYLEVSESSKPEVLCRLIDTNNIKLSLVFCNQKKRVDDLASGLQSRGYSAEALHGDMKQDQRDRVMSRFRKGQIDILIATDVAARGIDVENIEAVFNYDLPNDEEYYVHRIGRTGRAGKTGKAFSFVVGREIYKLKDIQRFTKSNVIRIKPPTVTDVEENRMNLLLSDVKRVMSEGKYSKFLPYIERVLEEVNPAGGDSEGNFATSMDAAAALLKLLSDQNLNKLSEIPEETESEDFTSDGKMARLFINIGSNNRIQPKHIIDSIASSTGLPGKIVGAINIYDKYTFVEVPREYAHQVLESMKDNVLRGKRINVEKSNKKKVPVRRNYNNTKSGR